MQLFFEQLINGWALGSLYALFGIGFGLVFATLGILNAAHGAYASWAAIIGYYTVTALGMPLPIAILAAVVGGGVIAIIVDQIAFQPLRSVGAGMLGALITSIGFWIILDSLAGFATNQQSLAFPPSSYPYNMVDFGVIRVPAMQIITIVDTDPGDGRHVVPHHPHEHRRGHAGGRLEPDGRQPRRCQRTHDHPADGVPRRRDVRSRGCPRRHHDQQRLVPAGRGAAAERLRGRGRRRL